MYGEVIQLRLLVLNLQLGLGQASLNQHLIREGLRQDEVSTATQGKHIEIIWRVLAVLAVVASKNDDVVSI